MGKAPALKKGISVSRRALQRHTDRIYLYINPGLSLCLQLGAVAKRNSSGTNVSARVQRKLEKKISLINSGRCWAVSLWH